MYVIGCFGAAMFLLIQLMTSLKYHVSYGAQPLSVSTVKILSSSWKWIRTKPHESDVRFEENEHIICVCRQIYRSAFIVKPLLSPMWQTITTAGVQIIPDIPVFSMLLCQDSVVNATKSHLLQTLFVTDIT